MTTAPAQPTSARQRLLARHPLVSFFVMAYALWWLVWTPWVLGKDGAGLLPINISGATSGLLNAAILAGPTHGPLFGTLILGVLWALWHLPEFLVPSLAASSGGGGILDIAMFFVITITFAIVITWVFNNTKGSLLLAMLVYASIDTFGSTLGKIFPAPAASSSLPLLISFGALAMVLAALTRRRLGYRQDADAALTDATAAQRVR
jgi:hypothetical protein